MLLIQIQLPQSVLFTPTVNIVLFANCGIEITHDMSGAKQNEADTHPSYALQHRYISMAYFTVETRGDVDEWMNNCSSFAYCYSASQFAEIGEISFDE